jgi:hypothetical protein
MKNNIAADCANKLQGNLGWSESHWNETKDLIVDALAKTEMETQKRMMEFIRWFLSQYRPVEEAFAYWQANVEGK